MQIMPILSNSAQTAQKTPSPRVVLLRAYVTAERGANPVDVSMYPLLLIFKRLNQSL
jgi:hypothetical protein